MTITSPRSSSRDAHSVLDRGALGTLAIAILIFLAPMQFWLRLNPSARSGNFELRALVLAALLSLVLPLIQIFAQIRQVGGAVVRGNRDHGVSSTGFPARLARAHRNLIEALGPFAVVVLAAHALDISNARTIGAAGMFLAARVVHALSYGAGIPVLRSAAFYAGLIATAIIAAQLPLI